MTQPEALRLADYLTDRNRLDLTCDEAAAELRRLHEVNQELLAVLKTALPELDDTTWVQARAAIAKGEMK
jgi:hypothetical protein